MPGAGQFVATVALPAPGALQHPALLLLALVSPLPPLLLPANPTNIKRLCTALMDILMYQSNCAHQKYEDEKHSTADQTTEDCCLHLTRVGKDACYTKGVHYRSELCVRSHQHHVLVTGPQQQQGMPRSSHTRKMAAKEAAAVVPPESKAKGEGLLRENSAMDTRSSSPVTRTMPLTEELAPCCSGALNTHAGLP